MSKSCQKLSKSCHKKLSPSDPQTQNSKTRNFSKKKRPRIDEFWMMKKEEATMKKLGIRRLDATSSHLVIIHEFPEMAKPPCRGRLKARRSTSGGRFISTS
jgi:hypothetical protein